jgi:predicted Zn finger-like uncharacterized protein
MDHRITQCPRCGTSFRVTEAHLAVAAGAVRCGSCLHIFNAREHWAADKPAPPPAPDMPISEQSLATFEIDDDALFDDDTPLFEEDREAVRPAESNIFNPIDDDFAIIDDGTPEQLTSNFIELNSWEQDIGSSFGAAEFEEEQATDDEHWAQQLLNDDESPAATTSRSATLDDYSAILDQVPETDEYEFNEEFLDIPAAGIAPQTASTSASDERSGDHPGDETIAMEALYAAEPLAENAPRNPLFSLSELGAEPLQLHQFVHESRWQKVLWGLGFIAALALLLGQLAYVNFSTLAHGALRPWLERVCAVANCSLPPQSDISQLRTSSLIVRSHPTHRGALAVDAIITNVASFSQPYPLLQLQFSDLNGAPVANRRFLPSEYLAGELSGSRLMPTQQPVHIALELVDPGPQAVNYSLTVVAPSAAP